MLFPLIGYLRRIADQTWQQLQQHSNSIDSLALSERAKQDAGQLLLEAAWSETDTGLQLEAVAKAFRKVQKLTGGAHE